MIIFGLRFEQLRPLFFSLDLSSDVTHDERLKETYVLTYSYSNTPKHSKRFQHLTHSAVKGVSVTTSTPATLVASRLPVAGPSHPSSRAQVSYNQAINHMGVVSSSCLASRSIAILLDMNIFFFFQYAAILVIVLNFDCFIMPTYMFSN